MLNVVGSSAALIGQEVSHANPVETVRRDVQRIQRSVARMNRLIGDLVDVASIEAGRLAVTLEVGDPAQVATEAVDSFRAQAAASGISLVEELAPPAFVAAFDHARILQVLINLLGNAMKFTPADGKVVVRVERIDDEIRFAVSDTGVGIPTDSLEAVFERFRQVNANDRRGVGLGLYIAKCIVQGHGGRIWAESKTGEGSTFCLHASRPYTLLPRGLRSCVGGPQAPFPPAVQTTPRSARQAAPRQPSFRVTANLPSTVSLSEE
jgi:signal transduction histidine kinase